jgi:hypothetical protein
MDAAWRPRRAAYPRPCSVADAQPSPTCMYTRIPTWELVAGNTFIVLPRRPERKASRLSEPAYQPNSGLALLPISRYVYDNTVDTSQPFCGSTTSVVFMIDCRALLSPGRGDGPHIRWQNSRAYIGNVGLKTQGQSAQTWTHAASRAGSFFSIGSSQSMLPHNVVGSQRSCLSALRLLRSP